MKPLRKLISTNGNIAAVAFFFALDATDSHESTRSTNITWQGDGLHSISELHMWAFASLSCCIIKGFFHLPVRRIYDTLSIRFFNFISPYIAWNESNRIDEGKRQNNGKIGWNFKQFRELVGRLISIPSISGGNLKWY